MIILTRHQSVCEQHKVFECIFCFLYVYYKDDYGKWENRFKNLPRTHWLLTFIILEPSNVSLFKRVWESSVNKSVSKECHWKVCLEWTTEFAMINIIDFEIWILEHVVHAQLVNIQQIEIQMFAQTVHIGRVAILFPVLNWERIHIDPLVDLVIGSGHSIHIRSFHNNQITWRPIILYP